MAGDSNKMDLLTDLNNTFIISINKFGFKSVLIKQIFAMRYKRVYLQINLNTFERQISHEKNGLSKVTIIHSWPH